MYFIIGFRVGVFFYVRKDIKNRFGNQLLDLPISWKFRLVDCSRLFASVNYRNKDRY